MASVQVGKVTDGLFTFLDAQLVGTIGEGQLGDGKAPDGFGPTYLVLYRVASGFADQGAFSEPSDMRYVKYQISAVGATRQQAEYLLDLVVAPFVELGTAGPANPVTIADHSVLEQTLATDIGLGSEGEFTAMQHIQLLVARVS